MAEHLDAVEAGLADLDPWRGFASYVEAVGVMQARDRGIADLVIMDVAAAPEIERLRAQAFDGLVRLVDRAACGCAARRLRNPGCRAASHGERRAGRTCARDRA